MDLKNYEMDDLLLTAIKAEAEAEELYNKLAEKVKGSYVKDKLRFIANEEVKHREFLESVFKVSYPGREIIIPPRSEVPLPDIVIPSGQVAASEIMIKAMEAEKAASDFYLALSEMFSGDDDTRRTLIYLSSMEMGHFNLLEIEKDRLEAEEDYNFEWEMMHVGP
jgi:rubrerythrin